ncbi:phosphatidylinositol kinase- protein kinase tor1 [Tulasnella sp. JGI-2019a]|nr:phosphatidylinositol kinase- protein kinase tor1 [Tulasnella sp. JGI-2019a]
MAAVDSDGVQNEVLTRIFNGLRSRNEIIRQEAAQELGTHVATTVTELSADGVAKLWNDHINRPLFTLIHSKVMHENLGGIAAINCLIDAEQEDTMEFKKNLFRLYNYVKTLLPSQDMNVMIAASKTLGRIAEAGGASFGDHFVDFEVPRALQLLQGDKDSGKYAAVLVLRELARHSPNHYYTYVSLVFDKIWIALRDARSVVREGAAELLAACLDIVQNRERNTRGPVHSKLLAEAMAGARQTHADSIHGSLLAFRELFLHANMFMKPHFVEVGDTILLYKDHKDALIRKTVIILIPTLAVYDTQTFSEKYLNKAMGQLLSQLKKPDRDLAFEAIGHVAAAVGSDMKTFLDPLMAYIKEGLQLKGKKNAPAEVAVFSCLAMLAEAVGPNLTKLLHDQLDLMFSCGLSDPLVKALEAISKHIPPLLKTIQERLLGLLSILLSGYNYKPLGAPAVNVRVDVTTTQKDGGAANGTASIKTPELLTLALNTLSNFDFSGHILNEFVRACALPYLDHDSPEVRKAAALACCKLFVRDPICYQKSNHAIEVISDVLEKLVTLAIADPEPSIRLTVLLSLDTRFDAHLAQAENVRSLFVALNDEVYANREQAVLIIGRLADLNPACVMPSMRKALIQLLTELEYSNVVRSKEESAKLLSSLIGASSRLIKPYALPMLKVLIPKARDPNPLVASNVLMCLGELAVVGGTELIERVPDMMRLIIDTLQDPSHAHKRDAALHTLGQLCSNTGYVIEPLLDHPHLLELLSRALKGEASTPVRRSIIKVMGILGALDPYKRQKKVVDEAHSEPARAVSSTDVVVALNTSGPSSEEYYQAVVINSLLRILKDSALVSSHPTVIEAIMAIFKTQGLKCVSFLPQIIPAFFGVIRTPGTRMQEFYLQQLAILVNIIKQHIRNYLGEILDLIKELWAFATLEGHVVALVESLAGALNAEFKPFVATVLPPMLKLFEGDVEKKSQVLTRVFQAFQSFGANAEEFLHLILPVTLRTIERTDSPMSLRIMALRTIDGLSRKVNLSDHASRIMHPLTRVLNTASAELRNVVMDTLCVLVVQLSADYAIFVPMVNKALVRNRMSNPRYEGLVARLMKGERMLYEYCPPDPWIEVKMEPQAMAEISKMMVNQQHLKEAWDISNTSTREEWLEWIRRLAVEFMKESPSHALRACKSLADSYAPLARELFNPAFVSCWTELYDTYQEDLVRCLEHAITATNAPAELIHIMLNLAEFMEHDDRTLPIDIQTLGEYATTYHAYAKALHYKEIQYFSDPSSTAIIEALINVNTKLQQHDAAWGTLTVARDRQDMARHEEWYEKLGRWGDALDAYNQRLQFEGDHSEIVLGRMRCLHALGEWEDLSDSVQSQWVNATHDERQQIAPLAAAAAWSLNQWDLMEDYIQVMKTDSTDRQFYRAILAVHRNQKTKAVQLINKARDLLDPELTAMVAESYGRSYNIVVRVQMLSELEEILDYKSYQDNDQFDKMDTMKKTWMKRIQGCQPDVEVWQRILQVRTLVLAPEDDYTMWIKFANLCRKSDRMTLADKTLNSLMPPPGSEENVHPAVLYAHLKYLWAVGKRSETLVWMSNFAERLMVDIQHPPQPSTPDHPTSATLSPPEMKKLLAKCYLKQGQWQQALKETWTVGNIRNILKSYSLATKHDPKWYKAWHTWALANYEVVDFLESTSQMDEVGAASLVGYIVSAVGGFFESINLRANNSLQDTLRLLTLWFKFGSHEAIAQAMEDGFSRVSVDTWLEVIPQIIARIQTPSTTVRRLISQLLIDVGKCHPQALIYPLTVASQSSNELRVSAARSIMDRMREHSPTIVNEAAVVSEELIRVAILWHEKWHEGLEEASRLYFSDKNPEAMIACLAPLHDELEAGPKTARETSFYQVFSRDLGEARQACRHFQAYGDASDLNRAWDIYYQVFKKVERQLPQLTTLDLQYVSPKLLSSRSLELAVPGTYHSGRPVTRIASFAPTLSVITSKQRPRRLSIKGSDGRDYQYLLKGHEDLRQDERVMQLFGLVNSLLAVDTASFKRHLHIQRYSVTPLAPNAGLLGWVQDSDTLHVLVRDYRESRKILLNIEYRLMLQMAPDYENLCLMQKVEVFEYALDNTTGQDLYSVLWLKSANSEAWLDRRSTYMRSLAVNSMVGHILGLGDRHPSNVLLNRVTGQVVHIDFGDCFEVAMTREKYPEKIPFRLTRMLTNAMEVCGIYGSFKNTCEISMTVLRDNSESLLAVLETFIWDPLLSWRLIQDRDTQQEARQADAAAATAHAPAPRRRLDERAIFDEGADDPAALNQQRNKKALEALRRVKDKLTGLDFANPRTPQTARRLLVPAQVDALIAQATSLENLCQCFSGWCAFW